MAPPCAKVRRVHVQDSTASVVFNRPWNLKSARYATAAAIGDGGDAAGCGDIAAVGASVSDAIDRGSAGRLGGFYEKGSCGKQCADNDISFHKQYSC